MPTSTHTRTQVHAAECSQLHDPEPCRTCGHFACWHRLDDAKNVSPVDPKAKFRCLGERFDGCGKGCPDYKGKLVNLDRGQEPTDEERNG